MTSSKYEAAHESKKGEKEESLMTILNEEQRGELTLLLAGAMMAMRRTIVSNFDANAGLTLEAMQKLSVTNEETTAGKPLVAGQKSGTAQMEAEKRLRERRQKELSVPRMRELKEQSLRFFDDWRGKVIERVGEAVNAKETAVKNLNSASPTEQKDHTPESRKVDPGKLDSNPTAAPDLTLEKLYPPIETRLAILPESARILIVHSTLLLLLSLEHYVAPSRILLLHLVSSLNLPLKTLIEDEEKLAKGLLEAAKQMSGDAEAEKAAQENSSSRKWKVGLASVAGAALIGVTGGLAAPLVAAGVGSVMGGLGLGATAAAGYLGSVAGSTILVGGLFGAYGGRMTGRMMDKYAKEVQDFAFLPVSDTNTASRIENEKIKKSISSKSDAVVGDLPGVQQPEGTNAQHSIFHRHPHEADNDEKVGKEDPAHRRLRVTIAITGWLTSKEQVTEPWHVLGSASEVFALRFELEALLNLGNSLDAMVSSAAWGYAKSEIIKRTVLAGLMDAAAWPLAILQVGRVVDNPFSIARSRSEKAGEVLADAIINKAQGERPVTLIGYSLGARVIYACLHSLARRNAFGLVESAIFIGAPCPSDTADWRIMRSVVSGRLVNVFSENDYVLSFLYRSSSAQLGVAGLQKIQGVPSVENIDVSSSVTGHLRYRHLVGSILAQIGYEDLDLNAIRKEESAYQTLLETEKKTTFAQTAKSQTGKVLESNPLGIHGREHDANSETSAEKEARVLEAEIQAKTEKNLIDHSHATARADKSRATTEQDPVQPVQAKNDSAQKNEHGKQEGWASSLTGGLI